MAKEMTDAQMLRKLKREIKGMVQRHQETMIERDNLVIALQGVIAAFCPGPDWATIPVRWEADLAITAARKNTYDPDA